MSVADLIRAFDERTSVPVDVNDVAAALAERGVKDEIYYLPTSLNSEVLRGQLVHWDVAADYEYPTDETQEVMVSVAAIFYAKELTDDWQRLVVCKELLHILDPDYARAHTPEVVQKLTDRIVLAPELQDVGDGAVAVTDRAAILQAVAVLFPWKARQLILEDGSLSTAEVARLVDLPQRYVALVLSDSWPAIHDIILSIKGE